MKFEAFKGISRRSTFLALQVILVMFAATTVCPGQSESNIEGGNTLAYPGQSVPRTIDVNGVTRSFNLYVPRSFKRKEGALVIALHGRGEGGPGAAMEKYTALDVTADREGFAIAYLDGLPDAAGTLNWNYFYDPFFQNAPDDVGFLRRVIDLLQERIEPDPRRIYVTGTSAGGFMAERAGVELSDRIAAIAVIEGGLYVLSPYSPQAIPDAVEPVSVLFLKGDQDPNNQYCGAVFPTFGVVEASSDQDFDYWTGPSADRCEDIDSSASLCASIGTGDAQGNVTPGLATEVTMKRANACKEHTEVKFYRLLGGLDQWNMGELNNPNATPYSPDLNRGTGITTNEVVWRFFLEHPKRGRSEKKPEAR